MLGDIEFEGSTLGSTDGSTLLLGNILGLRVGFNDNDGPELGAVDGLPLKDGASLGSEAGFYTQLTLQTSRVAESMDTDGPKLGTIEGNIHVDGITLGPRLGERETEGDVLGSLLGDIE